MAGTVAFIIVVAGVIVVDVTESGLTNGSSVSNTNCGSCCGCPCDVAAAVRGGCCSGRMGNAADESSNSSPHSQSELESPPPPLL